MDIKIEAPQHDNQEKLINYYKNKLENKFGHYKFVHSIDVKIKMISQGIYYVSIQLKPERQGNTIFASGKGSTENKALTNSIRKMHLQIQKYKQKHYHNSHTVQKFSSNDLSNIN